MVWTRGPAQWRWGSHNSVVKVCPPRIFLAMHRIPLKDKRVDILLLYVWFCVNPSVFQPFVCSHSSYIPWLKTGGTVFKQVLKAKENILEIIQSVMLSSRVPCLCYPSTIKVCIVDISTTYSMRPIGGNKRNISKTRFYLCSSQNCPEVEVWWSWSPLWSYEKNKGHISKIVHT